MERVDEADEELHGQDDGGKQEEEKEEEWWYNYDYIVLFSGYIKAIY